jgi:hypothetical protein
MFCMVVLAAFAASSSRPLFLPFFDCDGAAAAFLPARGATCLGVGAVFSFGAAFFFFGCALGISESIVSPCLSISALHAAMFTLRTAAS